MGFWNWLLRPDENTQPVDGKTSGHQLDTPLQREVGRYTQGRLGKTAFVHTYGALDSDARQSIIIAPDIPEEGVSTYASIGLSDYPQPNYGTPVRIELIGACYSDDGEFANIVSSCMIECLQNGREITYGVVFWDIVKQYCVSDTLSHVTFVAPPFWDGFTQAAMIDGDVLWLMILPISESEMVHLKTHGIDALERLLQLNDADVFDLNRKPVV
jgi:antitoxin YqcF